MWLGLAACGWLLLSIYPRVVKLSDCERERLAPNDPGYVHVTGGLEEGQVVVFTSNGALLKPRFYYMAFAPRTENFVALRRSRWGGEFRLLSVDLRYRSDGEVNRWNLGRINETCWTNIKRYVAEEWKTPDIEIIEEGMQGSA